MKIHSVAVLGAGAVGSYVIWGLSEKKDISLSVIAKGERAERLKAEGQAIGRAEGRAEGQVIGQAQGEARLGSLINRLIQEQRIDEIQIVSTDSERREQLYKEYNL